MAPNIPKVLYRGDSDTKDTRKLRELLKSDKLSTNLIAKGNPYEIYLPLIELMKQHISTGWPKTHFLSFSSDIQTALRFGLSLEEGNVEEELSNYIEMQTDNYRFVICHFNTNQIEFKSIAPGVYHGTYLSNSILLIDAVTVLKDTNNPAKENAKRDKEWLILPKNPMPDGIGYSAYLPLTQSSRIDYYTHIEDVPYDNPFSS